MPCTETLEKARSRAAASLHCRIFRRKTGFLPPLEFIIGPAFGRTRWPGQAFPENAPTYLRPMRAEDILLPTPAGLSCRPAGFHIDPTRPVDKAVLPPSHSDPAQAGH